MGSSKSTGNKLHFTVYKQGKPVKPNDFFKAVKQVNTHSHLSFRLGGCFLFPKRAGAFSFLN
ncbi:M23 family metallopeptidase [Brevibacillus laterosporus]|nr:M23 family metallopeptidase [Brevibacillus laterosporus]MED1910325.1 M23 family metallopeptidase [Brevibacillus laterosporus]